MQSCVITVEERMNVTHREEGAGKKRTKNYLKIWGSTLKRDEATNRETLATTRS